MLLAEMFLSPTTGYPLIAALLYAFAALVLKRSSQLGVGLWRTTFVANAIVAALFSLLWLLGGAPVRTEELWQPGLIALCLFAGQISQFLALEKGDVSVAVPVFGLKVIMVAFFTPILTGDSVSAKLWMAALLSVLGITLLNRKDAAQSARNLSITLLAGGLGNGGGGRLRRERTDTGKIEKSLGLGFGAPHFTRQLGQSGSDQGDRQAALGRAVKRGDQ